MAANNLRLVTIGTSSGLDVLVEADEGSTLPPHDPFSMGLLQAIWSAMSAMTESAALWLALSQRRWAEIGVAPFNLPPPPTGDDQTAMPGQVKRYREPSFSSLPFTMPSIPPPDDVAVTV
jgi:hypothetical protein